MLWYKPWSECVDLGTKLQNGEHGAIDEIKKVDEVTIRDFVESWGTLEQRRANDEIQAVKSVLRIIQHLKKVCLWYCNFGADHLRILCDVFNGVKINKLDISLNDIDSETWGQLGILVHQCGLKTLKARNCHPTAECLERFIQETNGAQIHKLDISGSDIDSETWGQLGILVHQCGLKTLKAEGCNPTAECLERFIQGTNGAQIHELDVSESYNFDAETWRQLGFLVHQCGLKTLKAEQCDPTAEGLERFIQGTNGAQINKLDISYNDIDAETWRQLGILVHHCGLKTLKAFVFRLTAECLERFIQGTNGAQFDELYIDADDVDVCHLIGRIVHQCGLKKLYSWFPTSRGPKKLIQGMDGTHLDHVVMSFEEYHNFRITGILKLLPLINEKLNIENLDFDEDYVEDLQEKLNDDQLRSLTIEYESVYLKASPMDLSPNLSKVEGLEVDETNGSVLLKWSQLSVPNVSYYIVVETRKDGKAVGGPIVTNETSCQLLYLQSETQYIFFIWGYKYDAISGRVAWTRHETGELNESHLSPELSVMQSNSERSGALNPEENELMMALPANSHINESQHPGTSQNNGATLKNWLNTAGQYKSSLEFQARAATFDALAVTYASVHANMQQTYIQQDTSTSVQQQPHQYPAGADGTIYNSADQGFQQPVQPVVNNPAPVLQESQRFDANAATGAKVNPSADYDMGASAAYGYPIDQSDVNAYQPTANQTAAFSMDQTFSKCVAYCGKSSFL